MGRAIILALATGVVLICAGGMLAVTDKGRPLNLQEVDEFTVRLTNGGANSTITLRQILGVGKDSPDNKDGAFDVTITDTTPAADKWLSAGSSPWQVKTAHGKPFSVPWVVSTKAGTRQVTFPLVQVPFVGVGTEACCGCGDEGSCGRGCAVEWSYSVASGVRPQGWGRVGYTVFPQTLVAGRQNKLTVNITAQGGRLNNGYVRLHLQPKEDTATARIIQVPAGLQQRRCGCGALLLEGKLGRQPQELRVVLGVIPSAPGPLVLRDVIQAGGDLVGLVYPRATVKPQQEVNRTERTIVWYLGDLMFRVREP